MSKLLQFPFVRIVVAILFITIGFIAAQLALNLLRPALSIADVGTAQILAFMLFTPATSFAYAFYVRLVEKREMIELGFSGALQEFGLGTLIGFGLFTLVIAILWLAGFYHVSGVDFALLGLIGALLGAFVSALVQELIFRAVIYRITEEWLGTRWALAISAVLFGLIHLTSEGATLLSAFSVALQAGLVLAAAYTLTHRLWMALGLHMAWDFANDGIFGIGAAGQSGAPLTGILHASLNGPDLLTGGALGVEASVISLVVVLIAGIIILRKAQQNGTFVRANEHNQQKTHPPDFRM